MRGGGGEKITGKSQKDNPDVQKKKKDDKMHVMGKFYDLRKITKPKGHRLPGNRKGEVRRESAPKCQGG